jgi:predicted membrane-bound mannosyltransferase
MIYKRRWLTPLVIAVILLGAWAFRWETVAVKQETVGNRSYITKWEQDRWTNTNYVEIYNAGGVTQNPPTEWAATTNATIIWVWAIIIDGVWLAWALRKEHKEAMDSNDIHME